MRYGRSPMSSRKMIAPGGGSKAHGVPIDAISCVNVPPTSTPEAVPGRSDSSWGGRRSPAGSACIITLRKVPSSYAAAPLDEPPIDHRPVNRRQPVPHVQVQQRSDVAVANQGLARRQHGFGIEMRQQLRAAVAAADGDERGDARIAPRLEDCPHARLDGASHERRLGEDRVVVDGLEPEPGELRHAGLDFRRRERAGRRHQCHPIAGLEPARDFASQIRRHFGRHQLVLFAAEDAA